jgi:hypothetical protein
MPSRALLEAGRPIEAVLGSPTIAPSLQQQLLVPDRQRLIRTFDASTDLPYRGSGPAMVILETEHEAGLADEVARYYPDATRRPIVPPNGNKPTVDELILEPSVLAAHRGLQFNGQVWRGLLALDIPGTYALRSPTGGALSVDGTLLSPAEHVQLARGNHLIEIRASQALVEWQTPVAPGGWLPVDPNALYVAPEGGNGLEATVYPSPEFEGTPNDVQIDPVVAHYYHTNPLVRLNVSPQLWSIEWRGTLDVATAGTYRFDAERLSRAGLWLDDQPVFDDTATDGIPSGLVTLSAGRHKIQIRLQNRGDGGPRLYLYWTPPNAPRTLLPGRALYPPEPHPAPQ